jgi:DNA polymerase (family 10)
LAQIATLRSQHGAMRLDEARALLLPLVTALAQSGARAELASDARRALEVVRDLRLVTTAKPSAIAALLSSLLPAAGAVDDDEGGPEDGAPVASSAGGVVVLAAGNARIHVVCADDEGYARALLHATGSAGHLDKLRVHARERGLVLEDVVAADEDGIYRALGLVPTDPLRRADDVPLALEGKAAPKLVTRGDLTGALHNHTTASDGVASLAQMAAAAAQRGLSWLGITDHSQSAGYAHGLDAARLSSQRDEIVAHNRSGAACTLLAGVESDILRDGALDYPDAVLAKLDVVVASVHQRYGQRGPEMTARMVTAARHPGVHVIGHPTGRLLLSRAATELDVSALVEACGQNGCALELNANPARLDLAVEHLVLCRERGVLVSIAADAHSEAALDHLDYGILMARRAGLLPEHVLNARPLAEVQTWLRARSAAPSTLASASASASA